jgi:hypothetical protein
VGADWLCWIDSPGPRKIRRGWRPGDLRVA